MLFEGGNVMLENGFCLGAPIAVGAVPKIGGGLLDKALNSGAGAEDSWVCTERSG